MLFRIITILSSLVSILCCGTGLIAGGWRSLFWLAVVFAGSFACFSLLSVLVVWLLCLPVDFDKPQEEDSPFYRNLAHIYIEALIQLLQARVTTRGLEHIPTGERFLLVCNHNAMADPGIILHHLKKSQLAFISKKENRDMFVVGKLMHPTLCQLIDREDDRAALKTILKCVQILKEDRASIAVFPEGATNSDDKLHRFRAGVFKIAQKAKVPIAVCTLTGTRGIIPNGIRLKPTEVEFHLLEVLHPEDYAGMKTTEIADLVYGIMAKDLGPGALAAE